MLYEAFKRNREERPTAAAFMVACGDRYVPISWKQFTDDIAVVVHLIKTHASGARIGLLGENSYAWMVAHAAVLFSGATVVPIDVNLNSAEISERLKFVGSTVMIYSALYSEKAEEVQRLTPGLIIGSFGARKTDLVLDVTRAALRLSKQNIWDEPSVSYAKISMIVFTSGTTSKPRGAELTVEGLEAMIGSWTRALPMAESQRSLMLLPLNHIFGVCATYLMLCRGVALGICPDFRRIYDDVERFRVNFLFLVPALAEILAQKILRHGRSVEEALGMPIDWIVTGGAPIHRSTHEKLTGLGIKMLCAYGLTETTSLFSVSPYSDAPRVGSAGKITDDPNTSVKVSPEGELMIKGPSVLKGYFLNPEKTAEAIDPDGWFHTGDRGRIDEDGYVWITGRASRTIILSTGKKIAPEELEEKIMQIPGIREVLVSGEGESRDIKAEVYALISEAQVTRGIGELNALLPVYKRIKTIVVRTEPFPRTSSGKIKVS